MGDARRDMVLGPSQCTMLVSYFLPPPRLRDAVEKRGYRPSSLDIGRCRSSSNRLVISYSRVADLAAASGKERKGGGALVDLTAASPGVIVAWVAAPPPNTVSTRRLGFLCPVPSPLGSLPFHPTQGF
ncbi:hypothetical protein [Oryza sativa Japonica Group]|uniref:Uncharacterized protein n=1 Tax=Oryza sativa subsp. japonica TaxID=39947 RepID=Q5ZB17_ORYSJ|nr:hypothetical protein [Oryza sativa Japonica Group]